MASLEILLSLLPIAFLPPVSAIQMPPSIAFPAIKSSDGGISFDPLGVLAVISNPRASASAARLYLQPDRPQFRWPHLLQIGGALTPLDMLVRHLTGSWKSVHPAAEVCAESMATMEVKGDVGSMGDYPRLMVDASNEWLKERLGFKPSARWPGNDVNVVRVRSLNETGVYHHHELDKKLADDPFGTEARFPAWKDGHETWLWVTAARISIIGIEVVMVLVVLAGVAFSALYGDMWALSLYTCYLFHWVASWMVSWTIMVIPAPLRVVKDSGMRFLVFKREAGGAVIFLGPQDVLEKWARTKWKFDGGGGTRFTFNNIVHWFWISSGSLAAVASVACMVNMGGYLQLGFLGMLAYSSVAEILLTILARYLRLHSRVFDAPVLITDNEKWYMSIIQATIGIDEKHRLCGRDGRDGDGKLYGIKWNEYGLLPSREPFESMFDVMTYLSEHENEPNVLANAEIRFRARTSVLSERGVGLAEKIWTEINRVWRARLERKISSQPVLASRPKRSNLARSREV